MLEKWRTERYSALLEQLVDGKELEQQVERDLLQHLSKVQEMILDGTQRPAAADCLAKLLIGDLQNPAFHQAKMLLQQYLGMLHARNVEDDQALKWHLEEFDFKGLKKLLGPTPEEGVAGTQEIFHQRLERIHHTVRSRIALAKESIHIPTSFAKEIYKLKAAQEDIGDYLERYKDPK